MIKASDLAKFGKVEKCGVEDGCFHILITEGFKPTTSNTMEITDKAIGEQYPSIKKAVSDNDLFDFVLSAKK